MSDSDDPGMYRVFAVQDTGEEFDLDIPPTSGLEYLRRVQKEAKHCPAIVVADIDASAFSHRQTVDSRVHRCTAGLHPAPAGFVPPLQWQQEQTANFSSIRQSLARYKARMAKEDQRKATKLPQKDNVQGWCRLCFGHVNNRQQNHSTTSPTSTSDETPRNGLLTGEGTEQGFSSGGTPPLLSIIAHMDQPTTVQVLEYHNNWFEATGFTQEQGQWFYALLTSLEKPLVPEACSLLRDLARNCANLRATLESAEDPRLIPLNLLICLVSRYFDQQDLSENG